MATKPSTRRARRRKALTMPQLVAWLKQRIMQGLLVPGQRLVEADLIRATGAGRAHVREALQRMETEGFVQIEEFRGASVRRLSPADVQAIGEVREVLEGLAARLAATAPLSAVARGHLSRLQRELDEAAARHEIDRYNATNRRYHALIAEQAGNPYATAFLERLRVPILGLQFQAFFASEKELKRNTDHQKITAAILRGDAAAAEAAMRAHIRRGNKDVAALGRMLPA
ncbi:MAG: GntR family transcriptional regulator [Gammaproteobacteria bacterium]|nr:GntR family transcriptional regulator [Gammaproteobacteria bacterium]